MHWFSSPDIAQQRTISLMLDPAGDAHHTGRTIDTSFERGVSMQCAQHLKTMLENNNQNLRVVLTRFPGDPIQPLQNANFANRLDVDCYISLHFYHEMAIKPSLYIYRFSYGDDFITKNSDLTFFSYDQAYRAQSKVTRRWTEMMEQILKDPLYTKQFHCAGIFKVPFKPLIGIKTPALAFEIGLKKAEDWKLYSDALIACLQAVIDTIGKESSAL